VQPKPASTSSVRLSKLPPPPLELAAAALTLSVTDVVVEPPCALAQDSVYVRVPAAVGVNVTLPLVA